MSPHHASSQLFPAVFRQGLLWLLISLPIWAYLVELPSFGRMQSNDYYAILGDLTDGTTLTRDPWRWLNLKSNEHRATLPVLVYGLNIALTNGNNLGLTCFSLLLLTLVLVMLVRALPAEIRSIPWARAVFGFFLAVFCYTPVAAHNVAMGFSGSIWFFSNALSLAAITALTRRAERGRFWALWPVLVFGIAAAFSHSTHLILWPALVAGGLFLRLSWRRMILLGAGTACVAALFALSYEALPYHPEMNTRHPRALLYYTAVYVGSLFSGELVTARLVGLLGIGVSLIVLGSSALLVFSKSENAKALRSLLAPWLMVLLYGLGNASLTAIGRSGFGEGQAMSSRYGSLAALFWIGCLTPFGLLAWRHRSTLAGRAAGITLAVLVGLLSVAMYLRGAPVIERFADRASRQGVAAIALVRGIHDDEIIEKTIAPWPVHVWNRRDYLQASGHVPFDREWPILIDQEIDPTRFADSLPDGLLGNVDRLVELPSGVLRLAGWAFGPEVEVAEVLVIDAQNTLRGEIALGIRRHDLVREIHRNALTAGWEGYALPGKGAENLRVFVHLTGDDTLYPLPMSVEIQAEAITEQLIPESLEEAENLNSLGEVARRRGDLDQAEELYRRALAIRQRPALESLDMALSLNGLGAVALARGDLDQAAKLFRRSLAIREQQAPGSLDVAAGLNNLGIVAKVRGDLEQAAELHQRALAIRQQQAPESLVVTTSLINLGVVAQARGDLEQATELSLQALAIQERLAPESPDAATSLINLGDLARVQGDLDQAAEYCRRAVSIFERQAPQSLDMARSLSAMALVARARGDLEQAAGMGHRALAIFERLASGSLGEAEISELLAAVYRQADQLEKSLELYLRSIDALETQIGKLRGSERIKADFRAKHRTKYRGAIKLLLTNNRPDEAFAALERWRARGFLTLLAEKDLTFGTDVPEELDDTRRRLAVLHDRALDELMGLSLAKDQEEIETLRKKLQGLRRQYDDNAQEIRLASPRLAALQYPQPLDLRRARGALDPGTVMLSYSVGEESSELFVVTRDGDLTVATLPVGEEALRREVQQLRRLIQEAQVGIRREQRLQLVGRRLYGKLIEPVAERVEQSDRILIVPDGPLHLLPFGALVRELGRGSSDTPERGWQYLVQWKPLHFALSATVYAELKRSRRSPGEPYHQALAAFGDPEFPRQLGLRNSDDIVDPLVRSVTRQGFRFRPLPATRIEVEQIAALYRDGAAAYLGTAATEERAKSLGPGTRYLHFATHGVLDERFPLDSALVLSIPAAFRDDRDNGLLQAWEIFERLRLDADLVVLSACDTGLGKELGGEGLIGLTRAFQYAGARSVVASLWAVEDPTTAELMVRFYRHLKDGKPKDEALRAAKIELIEGPVEHAAHPFYWAAFELMGDWR